MLNNDQEANLPADSGTTDFVFLPEEAGVTYFDHDVGPFVLVRQCGMDKSCQY
jgi:hypothetical protein